MDSLSKAKATGILFVVLCAVCVATNAQQIDPGIVDVEWQRQAYEAVLPEPFGHTRIELIHTGDGSIKIVAMLENGEVVVDDLFTEPVQSIAEPDVSFQVDDIGEDGSLSRFTIALEYDPPYLESDPDVVVCETPCQEWHRKGIFLRVDRGLIVEREPTSFFVRE